MSGQYEYPYPRPALTVDACIIAAGKKPGTVELLLVQRGRPPFTGHWALPGGFVGEMEDLPVAAARELEEETGADLASQLHQLETYGTPNRDPRGWTVTVVYAALLPEPLQEVRGGDDAADAVWYPVDDLPLLAFDHKRIIRRSLDAVSKWPQASELGVAAGLQDAVKKLVD